MGTGKFYKRGERAIFLVTNLANRVGACVLVGMMLLVSGDVFFRYFFNRPVAGTFELVEVMMGAIVSLSIAYTGLRRGHVAVELITDKLPDGIRRSLELLHHVVCIIFFSAVAYKCFQQAGIIRESETVTTLLEIPIFPFIWVLSFGAALLALVYLWQFINILGKRASE